MRRALSGVFLLMRILKNRSPAERQKLRFFIFVSEIYVDAALRTASNGLETSNDQAYSGRLTFGTAFVFAASIRFAISSSDAPSAAFLTSASAYSNSGVSSEL